MKKFFRMMSVALVALVFAACGSSNTPEAVTKKYLQTMQKGDYAAMLDQMYFKNGLTDEQKAELVGMVEEKAKAEVEKKGGIASFEIGAAEIAEDGQTAKVPYTLKYGDESTKEDNEDLILVDGKWWINSGK
ncbi:MAG: DUF4878 domain-containing protein [Paludibacteraceae bacterium]|nr:DUF4878 domain-containing protein [Paludibacteraceae bacterium]